MLARRLGAALGALRKKQVLKEHSVNVESQRDFLDRRQLVTALRSLRRGDFSVRLPEDSRASTSEIAASSTRWSASKRR
jgi:hypothetical protein